MSGGHFHYNQYRIGDNARNYPPHIIDEFKKGKKALRLALVYAQRIDWLVSGETFGGIEQNKRLDALRHI